MESQTEKQATIEYDKDDDGRLRYDIHKMHYANTLTTNGLYNDSGSAAHSSNLRVLRIVTVAETWPA
jgi:hypothetical protein